ncbi:restriction endonuclease subunit S [Bacillus cereus group sp. TH43LC]|uniref:restriction endonuclease subunit S n=1 Tax=unclassified Bacillus cereus group TaxID=2750818 RepID=UPI00147E49EC|nr:MULTISPECIES: restriction endonuclease subunit S [unclassified Bacillus cereus group]MDA1501603.1 restriction endonuclease subunit S [Bacillus cereus group sp. TH43LC]MDA2237190.1 restriction endonuclease subunit S [Bacillus cereus group sp. Bc222]
MKQNMEFKRLGDIATFINGNAFKPEDWGNKGLPIIRIQNLTNSSNEINYFEGEIAEKYIVNKGDILIAWSASLGVYEWEGETALLNQHIFKVVFDKIEINKSYFKYMVSIALNNALKYLHGSTMKHLTKKYFDNIEIPVPSLAQQSLISEVLNSSVSLINMRQSQISALEELAQSVFLEMFGDNITNKKNYTMIKIKDVAEKEKNSIKAGPFGSSLKKEFYVSKGYKIYGQEQVIRDDLSYGDYYIDEKKYNELISCSVKEGDVLISLVGTFGKVSIVPKEFELGIINPRLMKVTLDKNKVNPYFFKFLMTMPTTVQQISNSAHGGTMDIVNTKILKDFSIIVPAIREQEMFVGYLNQINDKKEQLQKSLVQMENLYNSILQRAFKGKLFNNKLYN